MGSDGVVALRLREVAEMEWREQRRKQEKRRLLERTKDLRHVVSDLERQARMLRLALCLRTPILSNIRRSQVL